MVGAQGPARPTAEAAVQIVAELAANAALHGRVPGRDALLKLHLADGGRTLRVEVTDTRGDRIPSTHPQPPAGDAESGRGLLIVDGLACRWGVTAGPPPRKTVWAELDFAPEPGEPCSGGLGGPSKERTEGKDPSKPRPSPAQGKLTLSGEKGQLGWRWGGLGVLGSPCIYRRHTSAPARASTPGRGPGHPGSKDLPDGYAVP